MKKLLNKPKLRAGILVLLAWAGVAASAEDVVLDQIIAVVNDGVVLSSDVHQEMQFFKQQANSTRQPVPPDDVLRTRVLEQLIDQEIQRQHAQNLGVAVDASSVNRRIEQIAGNNNMDTLQFSKTLQQQGFDYDHFRHSVERDLLLTRLLQRDVESRIRVSVQEIDDFVAAMNNDGDQQQRYKIEHILVAVPPSAPADELAAAEARVQAIRSRLLAGENFAQVAVAESDGARALQGGDLGWRTLQEVPDFLAEALPALSIEGISEPLRSQNGYHVVRLADQRSGNQRQQQETLARHIFITGNDTSTEQQLAGIGQRIKSGESFVAMAAQFSQDPNSANAGGELPWFAEGQMPAELETAAENVAIGQLTQPFRTQFGWHILEVLERRIREVSTAALRQRAEQSLRQRKIEQESERWIRQLRDESFIDIRS